MKSDNKKNNQQDALYHQNIGIIKLECLNFARILSILSSNHTHTTSHIFTNDIYVIFIIYCMQFKRVHPYHFVSIVNFTTLLFHLDSPSICSFSDIFLPLFFFLSSVLHLLAPFKSLLTFIDPV